MSERALYDADPAWSDEHKEAFVVYRDMGAERSLRAAGQYLGKSTTLMEQWSAKGTWRIRVAAWDAEQDRIRQEAHKAEIVKVTRRHARALEDSIKVLMQPALELARRIDQGEEFTQDLSPQELANLTHAASSVLPKLVQASRLVHGVSTENVSVKGEHRVKVEGATPEELDAALEGIEDSGVPLLEEGVTDAEIVE